MSRHYSPPRRRHAMPPLRDASPLGCFATITPRHYAEFFDASRLPTPPMPCRRFAADATAYFRCLSMPPPRFIFKIFAAADAMPLIRRWRCLRFIDAVCCCFRLAHDTLSIRFRHAHAFIFHLMS
jgi:hypothetical protein